MVAKLKKDGLNYVFFVSVCLISMLRLLDTTGGTVIFEVTTKNVWTEHMLWLVSVVSARYLPYIAVLGLLFTWFKEPLGVFYKRYCLFTWVVSVTYLITLVV